nr:hypothetical protein [uncultured Desulfuromonas sp.]
MKILNASWALLLFVILLAAPSNAATLNLVAKQPGSWHAVPDQGTAQLHYDLQSGYFDLEATGLQKKQNYALVQHNNTRTGKGYIIARLVTTDQGQAQIQGQWSRWQGKIWLVLDQDVRGTAGDLITDRLSDWHPRSYLFETRVLDPLDEDSADF